MKKIILPICLAAALCACEKHPEPYQYEQSTIYSESARSTFGSILLDIRPYILDNNVKKYIVAPVITKVTLKVDDEDFGDYPSLAMDTSVIEKQLVNSYFTTEEAIRYAVIVPFRTNNEPLHTAGQYSALLNNYVVLSPGFYHCRIASFELRLSDNTLKKVVTNITQNFEIKANTKNCYLGEFEILIK
jgi:hypothetical protein